MSIIGAYPYTFTNGTVADANQVNADLTFIASQVNANALPLAGGTMTGPLLGTSIAMTGDISGATGTFSGNVTANGVIVPVATSGTFATAASVAWVLAAGFSHYRITLAGLFSSGANHTVHLQLSYDSGATYVAAGYAYTGNAWAANQSNYIDQSGYGATAIPVNVAIANSLETATFPNLAVIDIRPSDGDTSVQVNSWLGQENLSLIGANTGSHGVPTNVRIVPSAGTITGAWTRANMNY